MTHLHVLTAGPASTVQDAGRPAWQHLGVSACGVADPLLAAVANALVGNPADAAVIESTLHGDRLQIRGAPVRVAVAGWAEVHVDGLAVPPFRAIRLHDGQVLDVLAVQRGRLVVVAFAGGLRTPLVLGSRSVHVRSGVGGGLLRAGDRLPVLPDPQPDAPDLRLPENAVPPPSASVRVVAAPASAHFAADALEALLHTTWQVAAADRMGARLHAQADEAAGPVPSAPGRSLRPHGEPVSEGAVAGAIQVPPDGRPIVLGPDRQTMGGYAKLAVVISADLRHVAQRRTGEPLHLHLVDQQAALAARREAGAAQHRLLAQMAVARDVLPCESPRLLRALS